MASVGLHNIFLICFLEFTVDHKFQLHLSQNELFWAGPVVHKGVQLFPAHVFAGSVDTPHLCFAPHRV